VSSKVAEFDRLWLDISEERMERFEEMFSWSDATAHYYDGAALLPGLKVADFGCGPGHQAVEFARRVGPHGHVHALDINSEFLARTRARADAAGLGDRVSVHQLESAALPLQDASLDRVVVRNTLIHVPDPAETIKEFRRVLRPGGLAHMIEGDRRLIAVEPLSFAEWTEIIDAAEWVWHQPTIGRRLFGLSREAGFTEIEVQVITAADTEGRLLAMIRNITDFAAEGGMNKERVKKVLTTVEHGIAEGTYLAVSPQFIVTARV